LRDALRREVAGSFPFGHKRNRLIHKGVHRLPEFTFFSFSASDRCE
jgi:hypothetical protein